MPKRHTKKTPANSGITIVNLLNNTQLAASHLDTTVPSAESSSQQVTHAVTQALTQSGIQVHDIQFMGHGVNGYLARATIRKKAAIPDNNTGTGDSTGEQRVVCKCHLGQLNRTQAAQLRHELGVLSRLQQHPATTDYVNPCLDVVIAPIATIALFPIINGISLRDATGIMAEPDFSAKHRQELVRFIILEILDAIQRMHDRGVAHLQLNTDAILVDLTNGSSTSLNSSNSGSVGSAIQSILNTVKGQESIYYLDRVPNVGIRLTNFGIGCIDRDMACNLHSAIDKDPKFPRSKQVLKTNKTAIGRQYDIWCCGQLLLDLLDKTYTATALPVFRRNIKRYMISPGFKDRRPCGFVREKIILDIKHPV